jgi:hypothetical protein
MSKKGSGHQEEQMKRRKTHTPLEELGLQLESLLQTQQRQHNSDPPTSSSHAASHIVELSSLRTDSFTASHLRSILEEQGVLIIRGAFTDEAFNEARQALREAYLVDVEPQLVEKPPKEQDILELVQEKKYWEGTREVIGNKTFGYLMAQPEAKAEAPSVSFSGGLKVAVQPCSAYKANLALLCHRSSQLSLATLLKVTGNTNGMISQDSCKLFRGALTKPHVDLYGTSETRIQRVQALAVGPGEGTVRLCYARFSHLPSIRKLICKVVGKEGFYQQTGFCGIPEKSREGLLECLVKAQVLHAGEPGELIIWKSGVIHVEMQKVQTGKNTHRLVYKNDKKTKTERYVVGTQQPYNLSDQQLLEIGYMAEQGFLFHAYNNLNRDNAAGENSVHLKTTQWKKPRKIPQSEKERLSKAKSGLNDLGSFQQKHPPRRLHCLGVSQPATKLFDDKDALRIFQEEEVEEEEEEEEEEVEEVRKAASTKRRKQNK